MYWWIKVLDSQPCSVKPSDHTDRLEAPSHQFATNLTRKKHLQSGNELFHLLCSFSPQFLCSGCQQPYQLARDADGFHAMTMSYGLRLISHKPPQLSGSKAFTDLVCVTFVITVLWGSITYHSSAMLHHPGFPFASQVSDSQTSWA